MVTEGWLPWWLTSSGPTPRHKPVTASSGTDIPVEVLMKMRESAVMSVWNSGLLSRITW